MPADVFLSAGEASGDLQASLLARELLRRDPSLRIVALGGPRLAAAGARLMRDAVAEGWASMGHLRAYAKIPWLLGVMLGIAERLLADPPRLIVCVDFGAFNLRMLEWLRFRGYRGAAIYYFPPGAWIDAPAQARKVARVSSALTPFAHQRDFYRGLGLPIDYYGHPLAGEIAPRPQRPIASPPAIAAMPGSREEEVALHLPVLAAAAKRMHAARRVRFKTIAASDERARQIVEGWPEECGGASAVVRAEVGDALADADVAWVASGTAVLETALRGVPQIAFYRLGEAQYRIAQRRVPHIVRGPITLPNLVTGESVVPELLQYDFNPETLEAHTMRLLDDPDERRRQAEGVQRFRALLGPPDALARIGEHVARVLASLPR